jgi:hypothetical protein
MKLHKKLARLERKYQRLPQSAKIQKLRLIKSYKATAAKIEKLTGRKVL